jgi:hypothetical protein
MPHVPNKHKGPGNRKVGPGSDLVSLLLFIGALVLVLSLLALLDPSVKHLFLRLLP